MFLVSALSINSLSYKATNNNVNKLNITFLSLSQNEISLTLCFVRLRELPGVCYFKGQSFIFTLICPLFSTQNNEQFVFFLSSTKFAGFVLYCHVTASDV